MGINPYLNKSVNYTINAFLASSLSHAERFYQWRTIEDNLDQIKK